MKDLASFLREIPEHITSVNIYIIGDHIIMSNFTNIGTIGNLNYKGVQVANSINTNIGNLLKNKETVDIAKAIGELTKAIGAEENLQDETRQDLLDQMEFISGQATAAAEQRKSGMIRRTINDLAVYFAGAG